MGAPLRTRTMCDAATLQAATLGAHVRNMSVASGGSHVRWRQIFDELHFEPFHRRFPAQHTPTRVVQMNLPDELRRGILDDVVRVKTAEREIARRLNPAGSYHPWTLQFENAALFYEGCARFADLNWEVVREHFPTVADGGCHCNVFVPTAERPPVCRSPP